MQFQLDSVLAVGIIGARNCFEDLVTRRLEDYGFVMWRREWRERNDLRTFSVERYP